MRSTTLRQMIATLAILICFAAVPVRADVVGVSAVVDGPTTAEAGTLVVLDATTSEADHLRWVCVSTKPPTWLEVDNGRKAIFAAPRGVHSFVLVAVKVDAGGKPLIATTPHTVTITGSVDPIPPTPETLADRVRDAFTPGPDLVADAAILHGVCTALATAVADPAGSLKTDGDVITAADKALKLAGWTAGKHPRLSQLMGDTLGRDVGETPLTAAKRSDYATKFRAIADGAKQAGVR